jgi:hypothetical protein
MELFLKCPINPLNHKWILPAMFCGGNTMPEAPDLHFSILWGLNIAGEGLQI